MWDRGKNRKAFDLLVDMGFVICSEEDDSTYHGKLWLVRDNECYLATP